MRLLALALLATPLPAVGQVQSHGYRLSSIVRTGSESGLGLILEMGVDDSGTVLFRGTDMTGTHLFASSPGGSLVAVTPEDAGFFLGLAMTRGLPSVALVRRQPEGSTGQRLELWPPASVPSGTVLATEPDDFDTLFPSFDVNETGLVAFWAESGGEGRLQVGSSVPFEEVYTDLLGEAVQIPPSLADDGSVTFKDNAGSILRVAASGVTTTVASPATGFQLPLGIPQISGNGRFVFFSGNRGEGTGLFLAHVRNGVEEIHHLAGEDLDGFHLTTGFQLRDVRTESDADGTYAQLLFRARKAGVTALWTARFSLLDDEMDEPGLHVVGLRVGGGCPRRVAAPGDSVGLETLAAIGGQSRLGPRGEVFFTASLADFSQIIAHARPIGSRSGLTGATHQLRQAYLSVKRVASSSGTYDPFWSDDNISDLVAQANRNLQRESPSAIGLRLAEIIDITDPATTIGGDSWFNGNHSSTLWYETQALLHPECAWQPLAINVYLFNDLGGLCGICSTPPSLPCTSSSEIVILTPQTCGASSQSEGVALTLLHELGHYFGLLHTFEPLGNPMPCLPADSMAPCAFPYYGGALPVPGDGVRDTPSDPNDSFSLASWYISCPSVFMTSYRNVMSYYPGNSLTTAAFSAGQICRLEQHAVTERAHVLGPPAGFTRRR